MIILNESWEKIIKTSDVQLLKIHVKNTWMKGTVKIDMTTQSYGLAITITENSLWNGGAPWSLGLLRSRENKPFEWGAFLVGKEIQDERDIVGAMTSIVGDRGGEYTEDAEDQGIAGGTSIPVARVDDIGVDGMKSWITEMYNKYWGIQGQNRWFKEGHIPPDDLPISNIRVATPEESKVGPRADLAWQQQVRQG